MHGVFSVTGSVNIPVYQGGRIRADVAQAEATLAQRKADLADRKAAVEQEVRDAVIELQTANGQVKLAQNNRDYAHETLTQARDRFGAGVSTTLEVVQAQEQVAAADANYINSLFSLDLARLSLARATGQAEAVAPSLLKEPRKTATVSGVPREEQPVVSPDSGPASASFALPKNLKEEQR
jgi:outer membrane protein TolC